VIGCGFKEEAIPAQHFLPRFLQSADLLPRFDEKEGASPPYFSLDLFSMLNNRLIKRVKFKRSFNRSEGLVIHAAFKVEPGQ